MTPWLNNALVLAAVATVLWLVAHVCRAERWRRQITRFRRDRVGVAALAIVSLYLAVGLLDAIQVTDRQTVLDWLFRGVAQEKSYSAPLATHHYTAFQDEPLKSRHLLGTDELGRDVLLQILKACRTALVLGFLTSVIYIPLGTLFGLLAGYFKRWVDDVIQYVYSVLASVPEILLLIAILMVLGKGLVPLCIALGVTGWVGLCRLIRGETLRQSARTYVEAGRALGQGHGAILGRHLLPNVLHLVIINFVLGFGSIVLAESLLSYLGVGLPVGSASWGLMLDNARSELVREPSVWWNLAAASTALFFLVLSLNLLGDALARAFDPRAA